MKDTNTNTAAARNANTNAACPMLFDVVANDTGYLLWQGTIEAMAINADAVLVLFAGRLGEPADVFDYQGIRRFAADLALTDATEVPYTLHSGTKVTLMAGSTLLQ